MSTAHDGAAGRRASNKNQCENDLKASSSPFTGKQGMRAHQGCSNVSIDGWCFFVKIVACFLAEIQRGQLWSAYITFCPIVSTGHQMCCAMLAQKEALLILVGTVPWNHGWQLFWVCCAVEHGSPDLGAQKELQKLCLSDSK